MTHSIFAPAKLAALSLKNHFVMSPMTRSRATGNVPNALMVEYYTQRSGAGLIITEGTSPSPNGLGYARIPGAYSEAQAAGWGEIAKAVQAKGSHLFVQLMHTGRVTHPLNLPAGAEVVAPSAVRLEGDKMWTDQQQMQDFPAPRAMTSAEVQACIHEYAASAKNLVGAGVDGVELHGANGYLIEQFLNPHTNLRSDRFGGSVENRVRFALETAQACALAVGKEKVGIRFSPYGVFNKMKPYAEVDATYAALAAGLSKLGILFIEVVDMSSMGAPHVPDAVKASIRSGFHGAYIAAGGFDLEKAEKALDAKVCDLVSFGRPFLANPDLVEKLQHGWPLNEMDQATAYTPGPKGYTDYPVHEK